MPGTPGGTCAPAVSSEDGAPIFFSRGSSALLPAARSAIVRLFDDWTVAGAASPVRLHGYASREGGSTYNLSLSCRRAEAVSTELVLLGVPSALVTVFAHGPTVEHGADLKANRRVTSAVDRTPAPVPVPPSRAPAPSAGSAPALPATLRFWIQAFIPNTLPGAHAQPSGPFAGRQVFKGPPLPFHFNSCFETDERLFDPSPGAPSRMRFAIDFDTTSGTATHTESGDLTFEIDCTSGSVKCRRVPSPRVLVFNVARPVLPGSRRFDIQFDVEANDPCVFGSPNIAVRGNVAIDLGTRAVSSHVFSTLFPAIEMYADDGTGIRTFFTQSPAIGSVFALFAPGIVHHSNRFTF